MIFSEKQVPSPITSGTGFFADHELEQISRKPIRSICSISLFCRAFRAEKWFPLFLNAL